MSKALFTLQQLADHLPGIIRKGGDGGLPIEEVNFDSRRLRNPGQSLFVALRGDTRDGHAYLAKAWQQGVRAFLVEDASSLPEEAAYLQVEDTRKALQQTGRWYRDQFDYPVIAITGSNGKTIVKEWLATVLGEQFALAKSPESYNSQIGTPLSLLEMRPGLDLALIEAGISQPGEMERLEAIIRPQIGVMTHFGDAHARGFSSENEKLAEKLKLFRNCQLVFVSSDDELVLAAMKAQQLPFRTVGKSPYADLQLIKAQDSGQKWTLLLRENGGEQQVEMPVTGGAALENVLLVIALARHLGMSWEQIGRGLARLHPVSMRTELITDNPEVAIINDAYNADRASVQNALNLLEQERVHPGRAVILSDLEHQGEEQEKIQWELLDAARDKFGEHNIVLIGPVFHRLVKDIDGPDAFLTVDDFLTEFDYDRFRNKTVLLKGARRFALEAVIPYLSRRVTATWFKINMNHLVHNFRQFRARLPREVKITAMVKAFSYGSGTWEIAQALEQEDVDCLAVAYTSEGIALRTRGIDTPIVIMNADPQNIRQLFHFRLEPVAYSMDFVRQYARTGADLNRDRYPLHLKIDTGMRRLGFTESDLDELNAFLASEPKVQVVSALSHLASADEPGQDTLTHQQYDRFCAFMEALQLPDSEKPMRHLLNTAGIQRFPDYVMEMVRLGIGLYGISPVAQNELDLREVGSLHSVVTQVHEYEAGTPIGYSASEVTTRYSHIATVPIGYADGIRRSLSNGVGRFLVRGQRAPVIGRVCMDMLMLDVTDIPGVQSGDEVTLIGCQGKECISVKEIAKLCGTIPYEVLTGISQRVRRVYVRE